MARSRLRSARTNRGLWKLQGERHRESERERGGGGKRWRERERVNGHENKTDSRMDRDRKKEWKKIKETTVGGRRTKRDREGREMQRVARGREG